MVRASRRAFFEPGPHIRRPLGHGDLVAFAGTSGRLLGTSAQAAQHAPDARGARGDAEMLLHQGSDSFEGPSLIGIAMRARPLAKESEEVLPLYQGECRDTPWVSLGVQTCFPVLVTGISPATDRTRRRLDVAGHFADAPAFLEESHGYPTTDFQLLFSAFGSHVTLIGITDQFL